MKAIIYSLITLITLAFGACMPAKNSVEKAAEQEKLGKMIQAENFVFNATNANPQRMDILSILPNGGQQLQHLGPGYFVSIVKDSLSVNLPFYGRSYEANMDSRDNGIEFKTKKFKYSYSKNKRGFYDVTIDVDQQKSADKLILKVSEDGYSTLQVHSVRRDQMYFYGNIKPQKSDIL